MKKLILLSLILYSFSLFAQNNWTGDYSNARVQANGKNVNATDSIISRIQVIKKITYFPSIYTTRPGTIINYKDSALYRFTGVSWLKLETDTLSLSNRINLKLNISDTTKLHNQIVGKVNKSDSAGNLPGNYVTRNALHDTLLYNLSGKLTNKGNFNASVNQWPTGTIKNGDWWTISVIGYVNPDSLRVGDIITAKVDNPGQTNANWNIITHGTNTTVPQARTAGDGSIGYLKYNGLTKAAGQSYGGTSYASHTTRLNYDGILYATSFFAAGGSNNGGFFQTTGGYGIYAKCNSGTGSGAYIAQEGDNGGVNSSPTLVISRTGANAVGDSYTGKMVSIIDNPVRTTSTKTLEVLTANVSTFLLAPRSTSLQYSFRSYRNITGNNKILSVVDSVGNEKFAIKKDSTIANTHIFKGDTAKFNHVFKGNTAVADSELLPKRYVDAKINDTSIYVEDYNGNYFDWKGGINGYLSIENYTNPFTLNIDSGGFQLQSSNSWFEIDHSNKIFELIINNNKIVSGNLTEVTILNSKIDNNGYYYGNSPHAISQFMDSSITISLTQNVWVQITNTWKNLWPSTEYEGFTESNDTVIIGFKGDYIYNNEVNLLGVDSKDYEYRIMRRRNHVNTVVWTYKISSSGKAVLREINSYIQDALVGDRYWIELRSTSTAPGNVTIYGGRMRFTTLHLDLE